MIERLYEIICSHQDIEKDSLTVDMRMKEDLGINSYDVMELVCRVEEEFDVEIPDRKIRGLRTIQDVVAFLEANG